VILLLAILAARADEVDDAMRELEALIEQVEAEHTAPPDESEESAPADGGAEEPAESEPEPSEGP